MDFAYKHSRVKQYLKQGRVLRIETVINKPYDIGVLARLQHLPELVAKARAVNGRLLMMQRAGQGCAIETMLFERVSQPCVREGQQTGALRFGDPRAMALAGALCCLASSGLASDGARGLSHQLRDVAPADRGSMHLSRARASWVAQVAILAVIPPVLTAPNHCTEPDRTDQNQHPTCPAQTLLDRKEQKMGSHLLNSGGSDGARGPCSRHGRCGRAGYRSLDR
jgi:hypothetical protein